MKRRSLHLLLGTAVTGFFLWLAVPGASWTGKAHHIEAAARTLGSVEKLWLVPLLVLLSLFFWIKVYRWKVILGGVKRFRLRDLLPATMIGFMANNVLPAHMGEVVRVYVLGKTHCVSKAAVLSTVVLERTFDLLIILSFLGVCAFSEHTPSKVWLGGIVAGAGGSGVLLLLLAYVYRPDLLQRFLDRCTARLSRQARARVREIFSSGSRGLDLLLDPRRFAWVLILSWLHWLVLVAFIVIVLSAFSIQVPPTAAFLILVITTAGVMLPSVPGYWGVIQVCFVIALKAFGVRQETALASSLYFHLVTYVPVTLVGLGFMLRLGFHFRELAGSSSKTD